MANGIRKTNDGFTIGFARLGRRGLEPGTPDQQVHDGDTASVELAGNLGVRFLSVDAPETSFTLPAQALEAVDRRPGHDFIPISDPAWEQFLSDPFADSVPPFTAPLGDGLREYLNSRVGPGTATNHAELAERAKTALVAEVVQDMDELSQDRESFQFFLAFATEIMDGYGRLLGYLNRSQPQGPRPRSYNERLLIQGQVMPYFIWPNLDPYLRQPALLDAVPEPGAIAPPGVATAEKKPLDDARGWVRTAREQGLGLWGGDQPLRLLPSELRFLSRRTPPDRWLIDLAAGDDCLLAPQLYFTVANPEDRLYVPDHFLPLFEGKGWRRVTENG